MLAGGIAMAAIFDWPDALQLPLIVIDTSLIVTMC